jgi:hypothetical protein
VSGSRSIVVVKQRWLRKFDTAAEPWELSLDARELPLAGQARPAAGCNLELTKVEIEGLAGTWWTLGFEAFGDLDEVVSSLNRTLAATGCPAVDGAEMSYPEWLDSLPGSGLESG